MPMAVCLAQRAGIPGQVWDPIERQFTQNWKKRLPARMTKEKANSRIPSLLNILPHGVHSQAAEDTLPAMASEPVVAAPFRAGPAFTTEELAAQEDELEVCIGPIRI